MSSARFTTTSLAGLCLLLSPALFAADAPANTGVPPSAGLPGLRSRWDISVQPSYGSESEQHPQLIGMNLTTRERFEVLPITLRYRHAYDTTYTMTLPYIHRSEELQLGSDSLSASDSGLGDASLRLDHVFRHARMSGWEGSLGLGLSAPTGKSIYDSLGEGELPLGTGHYATGFHLDYRRISDPVVASLGVGLQYFWPRTHEGASIRPGVGFSARTGIGFALTDRCILTEQLEFTRQPNVFLQNSLTAMTEALDQAYITHGFLYCPSPGSASYSLRLSIGLNNQSTDFVLTLGTDR